MLEGRGERAHGAIPAHAGEPRCRTLAMDKYREGAIPAHAGEPQGGASNRCAHRGDPRACGGARSDSTGAHSGGRSPRMRGSRN